jgi:hypothetical protein
MIYDRQNITLSKKHLVMLLVRYLGHLGSATLAAGIIAAAVEITVPFRDPFFLGALFGGAIMGYLVNRNVRDLTGLLVWLVPLAWLIYGISESAMSYSQAWAISPGLHTFGTTSLGRAVADQSAWTNFFLPLHFCLRFLIQ